MKGKLLHVFLIFCCIPFFSDGDLSAQTFTSNSNGAWSSTSIWTRINPNNCSTQYPSPPPTNPSNIACAVNVIVNHTLTRANDTQFAQQFRSLQIRGTGSLDFSGNTNITFTNNAFGAVETTVDGGTLELYNIDLSNGATLRVINGGRVIVRNNLTTSGSGSNQITVDATSRITVTNNVTIASGHLLNINGTFSSKNFVSNGAIITIGSTATVAISNDFSLLSSGSMSISGSATLAIGQDFLSNGSAAFSSTNTSRISIGRHFINGSSGNFNVSANSALAVTGNFSSQGGAYVRFANDTRLTVGGTFTFGNGNFQVSEYSRVSITGNASHSGGTFISGNYADIRIKGNLSSTAGSFNASGYSFLGIGGSHTVSNYNGIFNLSGNSQVQANGSTTTPWNTLNAVDNSCYKSANRVAGTGCVLCGSTYVADGIFTVPAGVSSLTIEVWGAGGAGGSASTVRAGGGGGGAYSKRTVTVTPAQTLYIFTGQGAVANAGPSSGGGNTYVAENATQPFSSSLIFARGGNTPTFNNTTGALGGAALTNAELTIRANSVSYKGGNGATTGDPSGGGGSAAADNANGNNGQIPNGGADPRGAGGPGGSGNYYNTQGNPPPAGTYGGGGGGANGVTGELKLGGNGANGLVVISFTCPEAAPCSKVVNYGLNGQHTVIEYFCNGTWTPPTGLKEYAVSAIGGGGGGGYGNAAGGGGGGGISRQSFSDINIKPASGSSPVAEIGIPINTTFEVKVGQGGNGASAIARSSNGGESGVYGTFIDHAGNTVNHVVVARGGGGGGSSLASFINGLKGGSGGGGATYSSSPSLGAGGESGTIGISNRGAVAAMGPPTLQGGGGGGAGSVGFKGNNVGTASSTGGTGGVGALSGVPSKTELYAAGGGGTSSGGLSNNSGGNGGNGGGGNANNAGEGAAGFPNSGSGGGAGTTAGGNGASGRVFINYSIYSILPVEYLSFTATYQKNTRSGLLNWSTAKEWENAHFEIERAVNHAKDWQNIGQVSGAGYSDQPINYSYQDLKLPLHGGSIFYRLKQRDFDGDSSYSETKSILVDAIPGTSYWRAYPNPTSGDSFHLELMDNSAYHDDLLTVRIIAASGQFDVIESKGISSLNALISDVLKSKESGVYTLEISWNIHREYHKFILVK